MRENGDLNVFCCVSRLVFTLISFSFAHGRVHVREWEARQWEKMGSRLGRFVRRIVFPSISFSLFHGRVRVREWEMGQYAGNIKEMEKNGKTK